MRTVRGEKDEGESARVSAACPAAKREEIWKRDETELEENVSRVFNFRGVREARLKNTAAAAAAVS